MNFKKCENKEKRCCFFYLKKDNIASRQKIKQNKKMKKMKYSKDKNIQCLRVMQ